MLNHFLSTFPIAGCDVEGFDSLVSVARLCSRHGAIETAVESWELRVESMSSKEECAHQLLTCWVKTNRALEAS